MADAKTWMDLVPKYDTAGTLQTAVRISRRTVVGPASYATDGIPVDHSSVFSTVYAVKFLRAYVTATGVTDDRIYDVNEVGTDTIANRKFRWKVSRAPTPAGSNAAPTFTGDALGGHTHTYDKTNTPIGGVRAASLAAGVTVSTAAPPSLTAAATASGNQVDPDTSVGGPAVVLQAHTHSVPLAFIPEHDHTLAFTSTASGSTSSGTPTGTVSAPAFTGTAPATGKAEIAAATNLSTITIEWEVVGVLA